MTRRYPRGITKHAEGWRISVRVHGRLYQRRFKPSTPQAVVEEAMNRLGRAWRAGRLTVTAGTFGADVRRYLDQYFGQRPGREERERHLNLWIGALGADIWRVSITREDVSRVLHGWRASGLSPDTCNKRRAALQAFYTTLDGKSGVNPVRDVPKFRPAALEPRGLSFPDIARVFAKMAKCRTRARLKVMAYTGARPIQVRRIKPEDWNAAEQTLLLRSTDKGQGTKPHRVPLTSHAQAALKEFAQTEAWGTFASAPMGRMWKAAAEAAGIQGNVRPYDLRHSFGTELYRSTGDLRITKELMGHSTLAMTERYTLGAIPDRERAAIKVFNAALKRRRKSPEQLPVAEKSKKILKVV